MLDTVPHKLTADEIKNLDPETVAKNLIQRDITTQVCEIPETLYHLFVSPRQAKLFASWVGKHMTRLTKEALPA